MTISRLQYNKFWKSTGRALLLCFLWMVTGGMVHTDHDAVVCASGQHSHAALHSMATAVASDDLCPACEWSQAIAGEATAVCVLTIPLQSHWIRPQSRFSLIRTSVPSRCMLRAPPA